MYHSYFAATTYEDLSSHCHQGKECMPDIAAALYATRHVYAMPDACNWDRS